MLLMAIFAAPLNALAATYITDNGNMFSSGAKNQATSIIDNLVRRTRKEVLVYTVPSLNGQDVTAAADQAFQRNRTNGALIFISKQDKKLDIVAGTDTQQVLNQQRRNQVRDHILSDFRANKFDQGLIDGVSDISSILGGAATSSSGGVRAAQQGPNWVLIGFLIILALLAVWIIAGIVNARRQQPYFSYGQQPGGGMGYGQPGYGGPGWGGGGGGFMSGLLGGLGGALLGNALFDAFRPRDRFYDNPGGYDNPATGFQGQDWQGDDAGQVGGSSEGSWGGDSGGGGDSAGSWGGDGGGGDGGGGGDSGGSW